MEFSSSCCSGGSFALGLYTLQGSEIDLTMTAAVFQLNNIALMKHDNHHHHQQQQYENTTVVDCDNSWCTILGLPFEVSYGKLEEFIEPFLPEIVSYCILVVEADYDAGNEINIPKPDRCVLLHFSNSDVLTLFVQLYNNLQFSPQLINAPCIVIPLTSIHVIHRIGVHTEMDGMIPLPSCSVCLRRLRSDTCRIQGIKDISVSMKYFGNEDRCKVCATYTFSANTQLDGSTKASLSCMDCPVMHNIWTCLICSHRGCGRYTSRHAQMHFEQTGHSLSLELATGRIWDYRQDTFVHDEGSNSDDACSRENGIHAVSDSETSQKSNLLNSSAKDDSVESNLDPAIVDKLSIIHIEFEALLEAQLAEQQLYFEKQYAQETWKAIETSSHSSGIDKKGPMVTMPFATEGQLDILEAMKIEISAIEAEHQYILSTTKAVQQEIRSLKKSNDSFIREQKAMKDQIKQLHIREEEVTRERNERVADLRQQIVDLTMYIDTQGKIQSSPLRDEIIGGTIQTVVPPQPPPKKRK